MRLDRQSARCTLLLCLTASTLPLAGCRNPHPAERPKQAQPQQPVVKLAPPTPIAEKREDLGNGPTWNPHWDAFIERTLPPALLSPTAARAVASFCPAFNHESETDKRAFWAYTFQALAGAEAGLDPTASAHHTEAAVNVIDPVSKRRTRQEGLLQLTYQDVRRYGCNFDWNRDRHLRPGDPYRSILQPERNLACGLRIMHRQIIDQGKPLVTRSSYWSTLQPGTRSFAVFQKQMANVPAACGLGRLTPRKPAHRKR